MARVPLFDADNHLYETKDAFTRHLPDRYKHIIDYVEVRGRTKIMVKGQVSEYIPNPTFDVVAKPGAQEEYYRKGNPSGKSRREILGEPMRAIPAFREPAPRLELMNELGVDRTLMFPTLASLLEERLRDDPEATHAVIHSFNQWIYETWQFNYADRIFTTPVITLPIVEKALEELEWVVERGAKAILVRPAPVPGIRGSRSFGKPEFDPFWAKVVEHDLLVAMHSSDSGYSKYQNDWTGADNEMLPFRSGAPQAFRLLHAWRPVEDSVMALVCDGVLSRFPSLKVAIVENGMSWTGPLLRSLAHVYKKVPQDFTENPVDAVRRCIHVSPFWEESLDELADILGEDRVLFGSDYPHPEGLAVPPSFVEDLEAQGTSPERIRKFMGGNMARLMNVAVDDIAAVPA